MLETEKLLYCINNIYGLVKTIRNTYILWIFIIAKVYERWAAGHTTDLAVKTKVGTCASNHEIVGART